MSKSFKKLLPIVFTALFCFCATEPERPLSDLFETQELVITHEPFIIIDHKNRTSGGIIPEWVSLSLESNFRELEALDVYADSFVFVGRSEGSNFNALNIWSERFSADLDFPRLAAARIEARFSNDVRNPDLEYGAFLDALIRTASDAPWTGAQREDDFWIHKRFIGQGDAAQVSEDAIVERETWEFMILFTMERSHFASQLEAVFQNLRPDPSPSNRQTAAANEVRARFFEGF